jgi:mono/diheme cytochrome c family protein
MRKAMVFLAALGLLGAGLAQDGARLYGQYCQGCHQPSGQGVPGAFPPYGPGDLLLEPRGALVPDLGNGLRPARSP